LAARANRSLYTTYQGGAPPAGGGVGRELDREWAAQAFAVTGKKEGLCIAFFRLLLDAFGGAGLF
tara:strand:- start:66 stop:260 length:195 start_codon:yes stop_codon:yes gene_type:complete